MCVFVCVCTIGLPFPGMEEPDYGEAHNWALRAMQWGETDAAYTLGVRCAGKYRNKKKDHSEKDIVCCILNVGMSACVQCPESGC